MRRTISTMELLLLSTIWALIYLLGTSSTHYHYKVPDGTNSESPTPYLKRLLNLNKMAQHTPGT